MPITTNNPLPDSQATRFFAAPDATRQRQYEALRAYFLANRSAAAVAARFGYSPAAFRSLAHRFRRNCARIHDNRIVDASRGRLASHHFRLVGVQAAAKCDDINTHVTFTLAKSAGSNRPLYSNSTGPFIRT